ncbi:hypothetical protein [Xylella fastidiosa]|uniref:hypothetical protein n=1 Tax=Xylella fastidiosa TaxID=2371 RepID=UPI00030795A5|nr:hypothetical protein [Xylella fastidiosa]MDC6411210.1 hypothetical protein [Xylella fastidiosa subsp. multiplex]MDC6412115.1 hypothetical protein [Xylella fastidiosa subsp. multiplex]
MHRATQHTHPSNLGTARTTDDVIDDVINSKNWPYLWISAANVPPSTHQTTNNTPIRDNADARNHSTPASPITSY